MHRRRDQARRGGGSRRRHDPRRCPDRRRLAYGATPPLPRPRRAPRCGRRSRVRPARRAPDASLAPDATPTEALRTYGRAYVDHAVTHRGLFTLMFRPTGVSRGRPRTAASSISARLPRRRASCRATTRSGSRSPCGAAFTGSPPSTPPRTSAAATRPASRPIRRVGTDAVLDDLLGALRVAATTPKETSR